MSVKMKESVPSILFDIINYVFQFLLLLIFLYPVIYVISVSISDTFAIAMGDVKFWPVGFQTYGYKAILSDRSVYQAYLNTIFYSVAGTVMTLLLIALTAYPLAHKNFYGKSIVTIYFTITMFFSGGMIPTFLLVRDLQMYNTVWAIILPGAISTGALSMMNIIIMRTFFKGLPDSLIESAALDGASNWTILFRIILPLSKPVLATLGLFSMVGQWNNFQGPLLYLNDQKLFPLQVVLRKLIISQELRGMDLESSINQIMNLNPGIQNAGLLESIKMAAIIVSIGPIILVYPFIQKYFVKGLLIGSIKG